MAKDKPDKNRKDGCNQGLEDEQRATALISIKIPSLCLLYRVWMCVYLKAFHMLISK